MISKIEGLEQYEAFVAEYFGDKIIGKSFRQYMCAFMESHKVFELKCSSLNLTNLRDGFTGIEASFHFQKPNNKQAAKYYQISAIGP